MTGRRTSFWRRKERGRKPAGPGESGSGERPSPADPSVPPDVADLPDVPAFAALKGEAGRVESAPPDGAGADEPVASDQDPIAVAGETPGATAWSSGGTDEASALAPSDGAEDEDEVPVLFGSLPAMIAAEPVGPALLEAVGADGGDTAGEATVALSREELSEAIETPEETEVSVFLQQSLGSLEAEEAGGQSGHEPSVPAVSWRDEPEHWDSEEEAWKEITAEWAREESSDKQEPATEGEPEEGLPSSGTAEEEELEAPQHLVAPGGGEAEAPLVAQEPEAERYSDGEPQSRELERSEESPVEGVREHAEEPTEESTESVLDEPAAASPPEGSFEEEPEVPEAAELEPVLSEAQAEPGGSEGASATELASEGEPPDEGVVDEEPELPAPPPVEEQADVLAEETMAGSGPSGEKRRSLALAVLTGLVFASIALGLMAAGPAYFALLAFALVVVAEVEYVSAVRKSGFQPAALVMLLGTVLAFVSAARQGGVGVGFASAAVIVASSAWYAFGVIKTSPVANLSSTLYGFFYIGFPGALALVAMGFPEPHPGWRGLIAFPLSIAIAADVGGYLGGRRFGKHYVVRSVSPRKSLEGYLSGLLLALLVGAGFFAVGKVLQGAFSYWTLPRAMTGAVVVFGASVLGDLAESLLKRSLFLEDMSSILPGHGGMLDRIDSLLAAVPAFVVFTYFASG